MNIGARQGLINRIQKRSSETPGNNRGRAARTRVACPECPHQSTTQDGKVYVWVDDKAKKATCPNGHTFPIGQGCVSAS